MVYKDLQIHARLNILIAAIREEKKSVEEEKYNG